MKNNILGLDWFSILFFSLPKVGGGGLNAATGKYYYKVLLLSLWQLLPPQSSGTIQFTWRDELMVGSQAGEAKIQQQFFSWCLCLVLGPVSARSSPRVVQYHWVEGQLSMRERSKWATAQEWRVHATMSKEKADLCQLGGYVSCRKLLFFPWRGQYSLPIIFQSKNPFHTKLKSAIQKPILSAFRDLIPVIDGPI